jgi:hypothetical protein
MSTLAINDHRPARSTASSLSGVIAEMRDAEPRFMALAIIMVLAVLPTGLAVAMDARSIDGIELWGKALKFEVALAVYLFTLAFFARYMPVSVANARWYRIYSGSVVVAIVMEMAWIGGAAGLGTTSHFNTTPVGAVIYPLMGLAAVLLTSPTAVQAILIARNPATGLKPVLKDAVVLGLALTFPLTLLTAGTMAQMGSHFVGGSGAVLGAIPFMGWATDRGDLRVAHFFATHALHAIPLAGLAIAAIGGRQSRVAVWLAALCYGAFVVAIFLQAMAGRPFLAW